LLTDLFKGYPMDIEGMKARLRETAIGLGLPLGERDRTYNSRLAQELGLWAEEEGAGDAFHMAAFKAYFADGHNIGQISVLLELASAVGLSVETAADVLNKRLFREAVDQDWDYARKLAITAVPTFLINRDRLVGAQPYEMLENFVTTHGAAKRRRN